MNINRRNFFKIVGAGAVSSTALTSDLAAWESNGLIAALMFIYRFIVTYLPVLSLSKEVSS